MPRKNKNKFNDVKLAPEPQRRGRKRERTPSPVSEDEVGFTDILSIVRGCETWGQLMRSELLFEFDFYTTHMDWLRELWKTCKKEKSEKKSNDR